MNSEIFKKFTPNLKKTIVEAEKIALEQHAILDTEHELLSLLQNKETLAFEIITSFNIQPDRINLINSLLKHEQSAVSAEKITKDAKRSIQLAVHYASKYNHLSVGSEHLLLALISSKTFHSYIIIERIGVDPKKIKRQIESIFRGINRSFNEEPNPNSPFVINQLGRDLPQEGLLPEDSLDDMNFFNQGGGLPQAGMTSSRDKKESALDSFATNLNKSAQQGKLDPVIGRNVEINRIIQTLCRRTKNNPILIGEPGVGKTAIVEGLAQRITAGQVPTKLLNAEIYSLDLGSILAGTMYRGQFESRIKKITAEIEKRPNVILFVDEIHMMVGAGSTEGSIDAANLLKPMLSKGILRMIGSTTFDEFKKHIEKDPAFERRFQPIYVYPPTIDETVMILRGLKSHYENYHQVNYTDEAILAAADLSERYIHDRALPDKAIDLIDEAGASVNATVEPKGRLTIIKKELRELAKKKENYIQAEKYEDAAKLREREISLEAELKLIETANADKPKKLIEADRIAELVSKWTGVPVTGMNTRERKNYLALEKRLGKHIIGQDEAITELAKAIKRARVGISNPKRPIGSFIFLGPTGVGKTELAKVLASEIFGTEEALVKIDMSEFMEKHNVSRLIGAPAGYIGYEEGGRLTEKIRKNPYSVILFDEIEKAHPEVFNILLQIMEDGVLSDAKGRKVDFKNTIIIMTSNLGTDILRRSASIGFADADDIASEHKKLEASVMETVERTFRPEFVNRLDKIIVFYPLEPKSLRKIVDLQCRDLIERLENQNLHLSISAKARDLIAEKSRHPEFGARPIRKYIADHLETAITDAILADRYQKDAEIFVEVEEEKIVIK